MKLIVDEGVDKPIVDYLRTLGYDIYYVLEMLPGLSDQEVLSLANNERRVLMTMDTDFGELVFRLKEVSSGVLLLRIAGLDSIQKQRITEKVLRNYAEQIEGNFTVVTKDSVRIRKLY